MPTVRMSRFLKAVLFTDAAATAATGLLLIVGAPLLAGIFGLPPGFLTAAGLPLIPFAAFVAWVAARPSMPAAALRIVVWTNVLWVAGSVALVLARTFDPTPLGIGFVLAQAVVVGIFAELQYVGLRRASAA